MATHLKWKGILLLEDLARTPAGEWSACRWNRATGLWVPTGRIRGAPAGWSDYTGFVPRGVPKRAGAFIAIECKGDDGRLEPDQVAFLTRVVESGGIGIEGRAWDQIEAEYLDAIGLRRVDAVTIDLAV